MTFRTWWCAEEKLHFTSVHTLRQLKRDEGLFRPLPINLADQNGLKSLPRQIFSAYVKFGGNPCRDVETLGFTPVLTCSNLFTPQWGCPFVAQFQLFLQISPSESCYFSVLCPIMLKLHILSRLIESFATAYGLCSCIEIKLSIPLEAYALISSMERCSSAVTFQSCLVLLKNS